MRKYFLWILSIVLFIPFNIKAECSYARTSELSKMAGNVQFSYSYTLDESGTPKFKVDISNIRDGIYVIDNYGNSFVQDASYDVYNNSTIEYDVYSTDQNCPDKIRTVYIKIPYFNPYFYYDRCEEHSRRGCNLWQDTSQMNYDDIGKETIISKEKAETEKKLKPTYDFKPLIIAISGIAFLIIIILLISFIYRKRERK